MKVVFMGTPEFAAVSLERLLQAGFQVPLVLTQPDKPNRRGKKVAYLPVKELALRSKIPVLQPEHLKDEALLETLRKTDADFFVVVAYGRLLPKVILDIPKYGAINVHASLLPKYRGPAPIHWAILNGEKESGITTMLMDEGLDTGDILLQRAIPIPTERTVGELHDELAQLGGDLLLETLYGIKEGRIKPIPQDNEKATMSTLIHRETGRILWERGASEIHDQIRGTTPYPGAFSFLGVERIKLFSSRLNEKEDEPTNPQGKPGEVLLMSDRGMLVQTMDGSLWIDEIQWPGKKRMSVKDFLLGHESFVGMILGG